MRRIAILLSIVSLLMVGCVSTDLPKLIEALGKDPATVCGRIIYGPAVVQVYRTAAINVNVTCTNDGMSVTTPAPVGK